MLWLLSSPEDLRLLAVDDLIDHFKNGSSEGKDRMVDVSNYNLYVIFTF